MVNNSQRDRLAHGVVRRPRKGRAAYYWLAKPELIRAGFRPKSVKIEHDPTDPLHLAKIDVIARSLQERQAEWANLRVLRPFDGTLSSLVRLYEQHPESPYRELRPKTQITYSTVMGLLMRRVGEVVIGRLTGADVRRWYKEIALPDGSRRTYAYLNISILKAVLAFGSSFRLPECTQLRAELRDTKFRNGPGRKLRMTYDQVVAFRDAADRMGFPSMGLGLTLQYELALRQRDVIGEWLKDDLTTDGIRSGRWFWRDGLTWSHISKDGWLVKLVSKTSFTTAKEAEHRVADYPDLVARIALVPPERRIGPMVINETTGLPYTAPQYRNRFRVIARTAGIPDAVLNMDARAGAVTEAYESGASTEGAMAMAAHTRVSTSRRYNREVGEQTSRVAKLRVQSRERGPNK